MILLRVFGFSTWIALLIYMVDPQSMASSSLPLPSWLRWIGAVLGIIALPLTYWTFRSLDKNVTDTVAIRKGHTLVTEGSYRWVRHPLYSFGALMFIGFILLSANWFVGLTGISAFILLVLRTRTEEEKLIEVCGEDYREYMKRTGRFVPRLTRSRQ